jgi:hypothetical protein
VTDQQYGPAGVIHLELLLQSPDSGRDRVETLPTGRSHRRGLQPVGQLVRPVPLDLGPGQAVPRPEVALDQSLVGAHRQLEPIRYKPCGLPSPPQWRGQHALHPTQLAHRGRQPRRLVSTRRGQLRVDTDSGEALLCVQRGFAVPGQQERGRDAQVGGAPTN